MSEEDATGLFLDLVFFLILRKLESEDDVDAEPGKSPSDPAPVDLAANHGPRPEGKHSRSETNMFTFLHNRSLHRSLPTVLLSSYEEICSSFILSDYNFRQSIKSRANKKQSHPTFGIFPFIKTSFP